MSTENNTNNNYNSWISERTQQLKQKREMNKQFVLDFMSKHNVKEVVLQFDGCGDSGQIEDIEYNGETSTNLDLHEEKVLMISSDQKYVDGKWVVNTEPVEATADILFEEYAYLALEARHSGWEINEGSFGTIRIRADGSGGIEYNERIETVEYSEDEF
jgi:hypothetical protein